MTGKAILFLFILILAGTVFLNSDYFTVRQITLSAPPWMAVRVASLAGVRDGENIWRIDPAAVAGNIRRDPWVKDVVVTKDLPESIAIRVTQVALAGLVPFRGGFYQMDEEGTVLGEEKVPLTAGVPFLTGGTGMPYTVGRKPFSPPLRDDLAALEALQKVGVKVDEVHSGGGGITAYARAGAVIFLGPPGSESNLVARLQPLPTVLASLTKQGEKAVRIDVSRLGSVLVLPVKVE